MKPLTEKQKKVLEFIEARLRDNEPPSQREIAEHFGLAQNAVYQLVSYLKKKGYLVDSGGHRGLRLSEEYLGKIERTEGLPIVGRVAAGEPILAQENIEGYVNLNELFGQSKDTFILKVAGDSMVDEGIMDGDYVVVKPASMIENGRIGVVLLDDEATVKRVYLQRGRIALKAANEAAGYKTKYIKRNSENARIIGKVIGCLRTMG
ncbi:MAG TPA: transcriptional repressor LexA [Sedimentisphaerales bacterium]|nr:transcriptional repressor LexA [Sedimentisphaerales bacterium]